MSHRDTMRMISLGLASIPHVVESGRTRGFGPRHTGDAGSAKRRRKRRLTARARSVKRRYERERGRKVR